LGDDPAYRKKTLQRDGILVTGPRGKISPHPLVREQARWERNFIAAANDFGMTPSSRRRLGIQEPETAEDDEFFRVLDGGRSDTRKTEE
jgi:P27 family predicted phage terminase small subunit